MQGAEKGMEQKKRPLLLAFCIPVVLMTAVIFYKGIYPFGDNCFLRVDLYNQYMPFFMELRRKLQEGGSLLFSWHAGLGANYMALYAYYLASPMNWLLFLCPEAFVIELMTGLIVIKTGLCGVSFAWYLKKHFQTNTYATSLFAVFYALSGYLCAYNWNIMWLDGVILAPVIVLGLEKLVAEKKPFLFCGALGASILTNYYISIPICIFLVLYLGILLLPLSWKERGSSLRRFCVYLLLAVGLSAVLLLPAAMALKASGAGSAAFPTKIKFYFNILDVLARHCMNIKTELRSAHWPNLYCGSLVFLLLPLYVCCKQKSWREKLPRLLLLAFFYLSFSVNILDFCWHGFRYPNSLPARQSFLAVFFVLVLCFEGYLHFGEYSGACLMRIAGGALLFLLLCSCCAKQEKFTETGFVFTMLYLVLELLLLYWYREKCLKKNLAQLLLVCMVMLEAAVNLSETSIATTNRSRYLQDYKANQRLLSSVKAEEKDFFRVEEQCRMTKNDGMLGNFPTATFFSSTVNARMAHLYKRLGMSSSKVFYSHDGATPLTSALLSVRYLISEEEEGAPYGFAEGEESGFYRFIKQEQGKRLYQYTHTLPLGFGVLGDLSEKWDRETGNPIDVQNSLAEALGISKALFTPVLSYEKDEKIYTEIKEDGFYYAYPEKCSNRNIKAVWSEREKAGEAYERVYEKVYYPHALDLGWCRAGERLVFSRNGEKRSSERALEVSVYRMDQKVLEEMLQQLESMPMELVYMTDTRVTGRIDMKAAGMLATSIPNEAGWRVLVDGKEAEITAFADAMLGVKLEKGSHRVEFIYTPPGLYAGAALSALSLAAFLLLYQRHRVRQEAAHKARTAEG